MRYLSASLAVLLTMISLSSATAMNPYITPVNNPVLITPGKSVTGEVTNIDLVNRTVQVNDGLGVIQTIRLDAGIQILRNGDPIQLINLNFGDIVTLTTNSR